MIQKAKNWGNATPTFNLFNAANPGNIARDSLHFLGFAYSIRLNKNPQFVYIARDNGSHAMIIYRTNLNVLSVADPNFPGQSSRFISLSNGAFLPYESKANALAASQFYPEIKYLASSAIISSEGIAAHYEDMLSGRIGSQEPYYFPPSELVYYNGKEWVKLPDTLITQSDSVTLAARCIQCDYHYPGGDFTGMKWIKTNEDSSVFNDINGHLKIALTKGENVLPLQIYGQKNGAGWGYLDFKMPVIIKESKAGFSYWLGVINDKGEIQLHFGDRSMAGKFPGKWTGATTFKVDVKFDLAGNLTYYAKYTAICNSTRTQINSFNIESWIEEGVTKQNYTSLDGVNLPLSSSTGDNLVFSSTGASACRHLTRVVYNGEQVKYGCDSTSFVFFTIPKP